MLNRIGDWHGEKAAEAYKRYQRAWNDEDLRDFARHALIADRLRQSNRLSNAC